MVSLDLVLDFLAGEGIRATYAAVASATGARHARTLRNEPQFVHVDPRTAWVVLANEGYQPPATKHTRRPAATEIIRDGDDLARRAAAYGARIRRRPRAETTAKDYGASAADLETLRRVVAVRLPAVRFAGFTPSGAANGEYSFRLADGRSAWVRSPTAPDGNQRDRHPGRWLCGLTNNRAWKDVRSVDDVVDWLTVQAQGW